MKSADIRRKFIEFYKVRGHVEIPSASVVPENDPTTLFVSAGMQPLITNILGVPHPLGKRLVNSQKAIRMQDIEEVGNNRHTTFFEMLGNWSLGDYFKKEQLSWIWEFLTKELHLAKDRLCVSVLEGDHESVAIWKQLGIPQEKIYSYDVSKNWWSRAGVPDKMPPGEPGGPDSEVFFEFTQVPHDLKFGKVCHPNCDCGRFMEIANSVFMQYRKKKDGTLEELPNKNVDFGGGLERMTAATNDDPDVFQTDLFAGLVSSAGDIRARRIVADHIKAAVMMMADGVLPSNKLQGYVLRRLIRRAILYARPLGLSVEKLVVPAAEIYKDAYPAVLQQSHEIKLLVVEETLRFGRTLERGLKEVEKSDIIDGKTAFYLYESFGFPWEMTEELAREKGQIVDREGFEQEFREHQRKSRTAAAGMFKGGLADHSEEVIKLHTATHLLHQALRTILGSHVSQKGSNITAERLRFDFSHPTKVTDDELKRISDLVNQKIREDLPVTFNIMDKDEAIANGALAFFGERYGDKVKVYSIGDFSKEICGGPHVDKTGVLGSFTITKEESLGAGIRRIYATLSSSL
ncbi:MAG: Alanine-tRNA ligase [Candidatus Gottesmanbacteria bacterium GW2011_GWA1_47_8]|uniref:alanine--tRNA ligase n=1 Tax=Candidatus Gottesmanbacteria bacterium GW2011_GWA1_47_8 TaxID=1618438 RepID=A0A0G1TH40_9BACT|nr:MAG: Alanine-tRNA ligase [Candidatus Gottesmanbacteria bacterium GW2011_GWA1_47_8]